MPSAEKQLEDKMAAEDAKSHELGEPRCHTLPDTSHHPWSHEQLQLVDFWINEALARTTCSARDATAHLASMHAHLIRITNQIMLTFVADANISLHPDHHCDSPYKGPRRRW